VNAVSEENGQCFEAAQQEFHRSLLGVTEADNQTTTDMRIRLQVHTQRKTHVITRKTGRERL
jgi:hypothetical protein